jgi:hypothetical protein
MIDSNEPDRFKLYKLEPVGYDIGKAFKWFPEQKAKKEELNLLFLYWVYTKMGKPKRLTSIGIDLSDGS